MSVEGTPKATLKAWQTSSLSAKSDNHSVLDEESSFTTSCSSEIPFQGYGEAEVDDDKFLNKKACTSLGNSHDVSCGNESTSSQDLNSTMSRLALEGRNLLAQTEKLNAIRELLRKQRTPTKGSSAKSDQLEALRSKLEESLIKQSKLEQEKSELHKRLEEERKAMASRMEQLKALHLKLNIAEEGKAEMLTEKAKLVGCISLLRAQIDADRAECAELERQNEILKDQVSDLSETREDLKNCQQENQNLSGAIQSMQEKIETETQKLEASRADFEALKGLVAELESSCRALESKNEELRECVAKLEREKESQALEAKSCSDSLRSQLILAGSEVQRLESLLRTEKGKTDILRKSSGEDMAALKETLLEMQEMAGNLQQQSRRLMAEREAMLSEAESLKAANLSLQESSRTWERRFNVAAWSLHLKKVKLANLQRQNSLQRRRQEAANLELREALERQRDGDSLSETESEEGRNDHWSKWVLLSLALAGCFLRERRLASK